MPTVLSVFAASCIVFQTVLAAPVHNLPGFANAVAQTTYKDRSCGQQTGPCDIQPRYQATPQVREYSYAQPQAMPVYQQSEEQPADEESTPDQGQMDQTPAEDTQGAEQPAADEPTPDQGQMEQAPAEDDQSSEQPTEDESSPDQGQMEQAPAEDEQSQSEDQTQEAPSYTTTPASWNVDLSQLQPKQALLDEVKGHASQGSQALSDANQFDQAQLVDQTVYQPSQPPQPQIIIPQWPMHRPRKAYKKYKKFAHRSFKIRYFSGNRH
ncbi:hypothetical protein K7432_003171 [Basidiobolus ranarum]|uniref:Uncharacterized protein n=1 Tax=Basidiobolus ranarum TaxID=34480 RepID=A0ABR2X0E2_9FUNG